MERYLKLLYRFLGGIALSEQESGKAAEKKPK